MIRSIAIDDEPKALEVIAHHASKIDFLDLVASFSDPEAGLAYISNHDINLVFLDIQMPSITGIELAKYFKEDILVILTTAHSEYALDGYKINAIDYLLKPINFSSFLAAVSKAKRLAKNLQSKDFLFLNTGHQKIKINTKEIMYLTAEGNYTVYHSPQQKYLVRATLTDSFAELGNNNFIQIHRSTIISLSWITKIENNHVYIGADKFQVSEKYREDLVKRTV